MTESSEHNDDMSEDEESISKLTWRFNFAAFFFGVGWSYQYGFRTISYILLCLFGMASFLIMSADPWGTAHSFPQAFVLLCIIFILYMYLGVEGNRLLWDTGKYGTIHEMRKAQSLRELSSSIGCSVLVYFVLFLSMWMFAFSSSRYGPENRYRARFSGCSYELSHIKDALEPYMKDQNTLSDIDKHADILCPYIVPGYGDASSCKGMVEERVYYYCVPDTFRVNILNENQYEIIARSNDAENKCEICVTEMGITPENYSDCKPNARAQCKH